MHSFMWSVFYGPMLATLAAAGPIASIPTTTLHDSPDVIKRAGAGPSPYPYGAELKNEMQWENWKPKNANDKRDGEMIHNAYTNMKGMAVYAWHEADGKTETFKRWFAEADADKVKKVFERIMDMNALIPDTLPRMKNRILDRKDFKDKCKNDRFLNAYTLKKAGRFHICDNGIKQPDIDTLTCAKLDGTGSERYSSYKIRSLAGTMLHEVMHWVEIGDAGMGQHITDIKKGGSSASGCHQLTDANKLINAQNYHYLAAEAYMQKKGCHFVNPPPGTNSVDDPDDALLDEFDDGDTKAISIILRANVVGTYAENDWYVYETPVGQSALCKPANETVAKWSAADGAFMSWPAWPSGTFDINVDGMECQYKNDGTNPGALWCKNQAGPFKCYKDDKLDKKDGKYCDGARIYQQPYVYCQW